MSETDQLFFARTEGPLLLGSQSGSASSPSFSAKFDPLPAWAALARKARFQPAELARLIGTSLRNLQRFLRLHAQTTPSRWLNAMRQRDALVLLLSGRTVKETAMEVGYKRVSHFCREFKRLHELPPGFVAREKRRELSRFDNQLSRFDN